MKAETANLPAENGAYDYAFQEYINLLSSWSFLENIGLVQFPPMSMDDPVGNIDPNYELWTCLVPRISEHFNHVMTAMQSNEATASKRRLRNRSSKQAIMKPPKQQPRGSGNRYYNYLCCDKHENGCDCHD